MSKHISVREFYEHPIDLCFPDGNDMTLRYALYRPNAIRASVFADQKMPDRGKKHFVSLLIYFLSPAPDGSILVLYSNRENSNYRTVYEKIKNQWYNVYDSRWVKFDQIVSTGTILSDKHAGYITNF